MINLITGTPGAGKTSYALRFMLEQIKAGNRKLYVHGIPHLKVPHERVYCTSPICDVCNDIPEDQKHPSLLAENWYEHAPHGAVYFFDEAQHIYRPRSAGSKVPPSVQSFETHRHKGLDFFLITQNPKLIDSNIRSLVSRHIHLKPTWLKRFQYEWPECKQDVQSTSDAIRSSYTLDKKTFSLYQSATIHTKQKRKIPFAAFVLVFSLVSILGLSYRAYARFNKPQEQEQQIKTPLPTKQNNQIKQTIIPTTFALDHRTGVKEDDFTQLPDTCSFYSSTTVRCLVSFNQKNLFKNHFCIDSICYALLPIKNLEVTQVKNS